MEGSDKPCREESTILIWVNGKVQLVSIREDVVLLVQQVVFATAYHSGVIYAAEVGDDLFEDGKQWRSGIAEGDQLFSV